jgi:hypothetical protein
VSPDERSAVEGPLADLKSALAGNDVEAIKSATDRLMAAICAQVARARLLYPQQPADGEDDWWVGRPETVKLRSCRGRVAQELLDSGLDNPPDA